MAQEFDQYAREYEKLVSDPIRDRFAKNALFYLARKVELLLEFLSAEDAEPAKMSWLDVGCGKGEMLQIGEKHFAGISGCDPAAEMFRDSPLSCLRLQPSPGTLPYEDASCDLITAVCVYHHVPPAERKALGDEIKRVLRPGGYFCIFEHNPWNPVTRRIVRHCPIDRNAVLLSRPEAVRVLGQSGFVASRSAYFLYFPESVYRKCGFMERWLSSLPMGGQFGVLFRKND